MKTWGVRFLVIGVLSFILPFFGLQFKIMSLIGSSFTTSAILTAIGLILLGLAPESDRKAQATSNMIFSSVGGIAAVVVFALGFAWFMKPKSGSATFASTPAVKQEASPTQLHSECFKTQKSESCRKLASYYLLMGDKTAANSSFYKACTLGDQSSCGNNQRQPSTAQASRLSIEQLLPQGQFEVEIVDLKMMVPGNLKTIRFQTIGATRLTVSKTTDGGLSFQSSEHPLLAYGFNINTASAQLSINGLEQPLPSRYFENRTTPISPNDGYAWTFTQTNRNNPELSLKAEITLSKLIAEQKCLLSVDATETGHTTVKSTRFLRFPCSNLNTKTAANFR